jgi:predicted ATPase
VYLSRYEDDISVERLTDDSSLESEKTDISFTDLALHYYARPSFPVVMSFRDYVQKWQFCKIAPDQIRSSRFMRLEKSRRLIKDGSNLANVLHYLREEQPVDFEYIQGELHAILGFSKLQIREEEIDVDLLKEKRYGPGRVYLELEEERFAGLKPFSPDNLSDGTLGLLALLTTLSVSDPAPLICLEEPERSTHPQLLRRLASYLHEAAQYTQLIITTHSAEFLDHFDPYEQEYLQVLIVHRDPEGATQFTPIRKVQNIKAWLEDYMLGQVWTMGQIEEMLEVE